ncbi:MAG: hypothetical protein KAI24_12485 [Planctomycetes bacterium]|nr:hypothetical protein [Planctomycetota bacterium]
MPAFSLLKGALCALPLLPLGETTEPVLEVREGRGYVQVSVGGHDEIFLGCVIGALQPEMEHYLVGLPPLLSDHVLLGSGIGWPDGGYTVALRSSSLPANVPIFLQGVTLTEAGVQATDVRKFTAQGGQASTDGD